MGVADTVDWACVLCGCHIQNDWASRATNLHQTCVKLEHSSTETTQMIQKDATTGNWWLAASSQECIHSCIPSHAEIFVKHQITQVTQPPYSPDLTSCNFWLFPKLKSPLKGKRFQTIDEIQENIMGQLMVIERTVWGSKVPTYLEGAEVTLSYVQCFLYLCLRQ